VSKEYLPQNMGYVADKSAHLFVDLSAMNAFFSGIQADQPFTYQICLADS